MSLMTLKVDSGRVALLSGRATAGAVTVSAMVPADVLSRVLRFTSHPRFLWADTMMFA